MPKESQQASADQAVDGVLHLGGKILTNLGTQGRSVVRSYPQNMVLAGPRGRVTENIALERKVGKKFGRWLEACRRGIPGSVWS